MTNYLKKVSGILLVFIFIVVMNTPVYANESFLEQDSERLKIGKMRFDQFNEILDASMINKSSQAEMDEAFLKAGFIKIPSSTLVSDDVSIKSNNNDVTYYGPTIYWDSQSYDYIATGSFAWNDEEFLTDTKIVL